MRSRAKQGKEPWDVLTRLTRRHSNPAAADTTPPCGAAVLIDAENNPGGKDLGLILQHAQTRFGPLWIKRAYGDWTGARHAMLTTVMRDNGVHTIHTQQSKNSADLVMIADAIQLAYTTPNYVTTFVLLTCDGDFADVCRRLRELGRGVHIYGHHPMVPAKLSGTVDSYTTADAVRGQLLTEPIKDLVGSLRADAGGWVSLAKTVAAANRIGLDLGARPGRYLKNCGLFEVTERGTPANGQSDCFIRPVQEPR